MNFLKISSLVIGTGSVVGGTGAGIYYGVIKNNLEEDTQKSEEQLHAKTQFDGKLVFEKKTDDNYEIKFLTENEYNNEVTLFDSSESKENKYADVNKVIEISFQLNIPETITKLNDILGLPLNLAEIKSKISTKENELKELFNDDILENLKTKFEISQSEIKG